MEQNNWRAGMYPEYQDEFTYPPLDDDMSVHQPPASNNHGKRRNHPVLNYMNYGEQQNQHFPSSFLQESMGNNLPSYDTLNAHNAPSSFQGMGMSAGNTPSASPYRYSISQPLPGMSPYDELPSSVSPSEIFGQPSAKKQKVNEYGSSYGYSSAQPATPPRRVTRGSKVDYTEYFSSPLTEDQSSSPATSVEHNTNPSKDPHGELQPFPDAPHPSGSQYYGEQAHSLDFLAHEHFTLDPALAQNDLSLLENPADDPVFPKTRARGFTAKGPAKKTAAPAAAPKGQNLKRLARKQAPKKSNLAATKSGTLKKYFKPLNESQFNDTVLAAQFPEFEQQYAALQASEEQGDGDESDEENFDDDEEVDTDPAVLQSIAYLSKPEPAGQPEVYSHGRQPLCDALRYYQAHQGGCYRNGGITYGLLISSVVGIRDKFEEEVIITTCGGGRKKNAAGQMVQMEDQKLNNNYAKCMKGAMATGQFVGVIAGQANAITPVKLPHAFNVLGWFHVTDVWMEPRNGFKSWCVRLEKIDLSQPSWWMPKGKPFVAGSYTITAPTKVCGQCQKPSKCMFNVGWMCMNTSCPQYFTHPDLNGDQGLDYSTEFLQERTRFTGNPPGPLAPALPTLQDGQWGTEEKHKKGIVCPKCRCCSRRIDWEEWRCENKPCDFVHRVELQPVSAQDAISNSPVKLSKTLDYHCDDRVSRSNVMPLGNYTYCVYELPGIEKSCGRVYHIRSNGTVNQHKDGSNDLFAQMQTENFGLKRNPVRNAGKTQEVVTNHWTANHGAPYKYGVRQGTSEPFSNAPETVLKAIKRLQWVCERALDREVATPDQDNSKDALLPFNEVLSVGYFQTSKMGYHDDGEKELGPTVASISFGAAATMSWRPKKKNDIPGGASSAKKTKGDVLKIILRHGDIMIMDGSDIQKYYEHQVEAHGKIRFAMTCRHVKLHTIVVKDKKGVVQVQATQDLIEAATKAATMPEGHEKYDYDGDAVIPEKHATKDAKRLAASMGRYAAGQILTGSIEKDQFLASFHEALEGSLRH